MRRIVSERTVAAASAILAIVSLCPPCRGQSLDDLPVPDSSPPPPRRAQREDRGAAAGEPAAGQSKPATASRRDPPPAADAQAAAAKIRDLYDEEIRRASQPQFRAQVVRSFVQLSKDDTLTAAQSWAMLQLAIEIAKQDDDLKVFDEAIQAATTAFNGVDADALWLAYLTAKFDLMPRMTGDHVVEALRVNERLRQSERFNEASEAVGLAERMLRKVDAATGAQCREKIAAAAGATAAEQETAAAASAARESLAKDPADGAAHLAVAIHAAGRGDWAAACVHLSRCDRADLRQAAEAEAGCGEDPKMMCEVADRWWRIASSESHADAAGDVARQPLPAFVVRAVRLHGADIYERALAKGINDLLSRKEAQKRVDEARGAIVARPVVPGPPAVAAPRLPAIFDAEAFRRFEQDRANQWRRFTDATRDKNMNDRRIAALALERIRPQWCDALGPLTRDESLPQRQQAVRDILARDQQCGDVHLCDSYLWMLAGDKAAAKRSFGRARDLVGGDPYGQVFCARQLLDLASAALFVDDIEAAQQINNKVLQKWFPNHPSVLQVQALMFIAQPRPRFADAIDKLRAAYLKTQGADRAAVAASLAWLLAATPLDTSLRKPEEADNFADEAIRGLNGRSWWAWRAKAELRASEKKWDDALEQLARAHAQAPLIHAEELERQRRCYQEKRSYEIERKGANP